MLSYAKHILAATAAEFAGYQGSPTAGSKTADLSTGEIRIEQPRWLADALLSGVRHAPLGYVDPQGIIGLRERYAALLGAQGFAVDAGQVLVTAGAKEAIFVALVASCDGEGTRLLFPRPGWPPYSMWAQSLGVPVQFYDPRDPGLVRRLEALFQQAPSSVLVINFPHNPTGVEIGGEVLAAILERARYHRVTVISDEVYRCFARANPVGSVLSRVQAGEGQLIHVDSLSKMLGVAGLRIGFLVADPATVKKFEVVRSSFGSCVSSVAQEIAQAILSHDQCHEWMAQIERVSRQTLSFVAERLRHHGYEVESAGALYLWVKDPLMADGQTTTQIALGGTAARVAPGHLFGCPGFFRLCSIRENAVLESVFPENQTSRKRD